MAGSSPRQRLEDAQWFAADRLGLGGVEFGLVDVGAPRAEPPALTLKKPRRMLEIYADVLNRMAGGGNILELGLNHGGSAAFFTALLEPARLVSVDIAGPVKRFDLWRAKHPLGERIVPRYGTSQADEAGLRRILAEDFEGPLDLVLDDASHDYALTLASFEVLFPALRAGGCYAIEDWQWAHAPGFWDRADQPALSNLIFRLLMVAAGRPDLVAKVEVFQSVVFVWKGEGASSAERLDLDSLCFMQGRAFKLL